MRLTEATVELRPRTPMEAIDLGVLLARRHRGLLMTSWAIVTLPVLAVLSLLLNDAPHFVALILWWLKPLFERLPLLILSQALFGPPPTLKQALKAWPCTLTSQLLPSLLWRRLSLSRSFLLPVQQLENLSGQQRALRVAPLRRKDISAARLLTLVGVHLETALWFGFSALVLALLPLQMETGHFLRMMLGAEGQPQWLDHVSNVLYALVLIVWGPVYVACGFTLYLNRRTLLEAWDIELVFRRMRQRLTGSAYALLVGLIVILAPVGTPAWANTAANFSCPLPDAASVADADFFAAPDTPRLVHQPLTSQAAQSAIKEVLQQPPFRNPETVSGWRLTDTAQENGRSVPQHDFDALARWLNGLTGLSDLLARVLEVALWAVFIGLAGLVIYRYRQWFAVFVAPRSRASGPLRDAPNQLFGLEISPQTLPDDIAGSAYQLWETQPREALGLLYRGLLSHLHRQRQLPLTSADTEGEVLARIADLNSPALHDFARTLTHHWQNLAYGHRLPPPALRNELCEGWHRVFADEATR